MCTLKYWVINKMNATLTLVFLVGFFSTDVAFSNTYKYYKPGSTAEESTQSAATLSCPSGTRVFLSGANVYCRKDSGITHAYTCPVGFTTPAIDPNGRIKDQCKNRFNVYKDVVCRKGTHTVETGRDSCIERGYVFIRIGSTSSSSINFSTNADDSAKINSVSLRCLVSGSTMETSSTVAYCRALQAPPIICSGTEESRACTIANGVGTQTRRCLKDGQAASSWSHCGISRCNDGFENINNKCIQRITFTCPASATAIVKANASSAWRSWDRNATVNFTSLSINNSQNNLDCIYGDGPNKVVLFQQRPKQGNTPYSCSLNSSQRTFTCSSP